MIRILIIDDHPIVLYGLNARLIQEKDIEVLGEASDGLMALELLNTLAPDVVLLGLLMRGIDGLSVLRVLQGSNNPAKFILLTALEDKSMFVEALKLGCRGIMSKQILSDKIVTGIRRVNGGEIWLDLGTPTALIQHFRGMNCGRNRDVEEAERDIQRLTTRERDVVRCVAHGQKNKQIADQLQVSSQTVKNHLHNIFDKLCISDRLELALFALHSGLDEEDVRTSNLAQDSDVMVVGAPSQIPSTKVTGTSD